MTQHAGVVKGYIETNREWEFLINLKYNNNNKQKKSLTIARLRYEILKSKT